MSHFFCRCGWKARANRCLSNKKSKTTKTIKANLPQSTLQHNLIIKYQRSNITIHIIHFRKWCLSLIVNGVLDDASFLPFLDHASTLSSSVDATGWLVCHLPPLGMLCHRWAIVGPSSCPRSIHCHRTKRCAPAAICCLIGSTAAAFKCWKMKLMIKWVRFALHC